MPPVQSQGRVSFLFNIFVQSKTFKQVLIPVSVYCYISFFGLCPRMATPTNKAAFAPSVLGSVVTDRLDVNLSFF